MNVRPTATGANNLFAISEVSLQYKLTQAPDQRSKIGGSSDAYFLIKPFFGMDIELREQFYVILLNQANQVLAVSRISEGGICATVADLRIILCLALQTLASKIILVHNHPSGNLQASSADKELTSKLKKGAELMDIKVIDHLIVSDYDYMSFADEGLI